MLRIGQHNVSLSRQGTMEFRSMVVGGCVNRKINPVSTENLSKYLIFQKNYEVDLYECIRYLRKYYKSFFESV